ncbi:MAG: MiaB/RimO family radical SAM methylthiotransferase [Planctomycetota bacterium]
MPAVLGETISLPVLKTRTMKPWDEQRKPPDVAAPMRTFSVHTLGCRVNHYESEQIAEQLRRRGLRQVERGGDVRVVNSCAVTNEASAKSRKMARRFGRDGAAVGGVTVVVGCWATAEPEQAAAIDGVSAVVTHRDSAAAAIDRVLGRHRPATHLPLLGTEGADRTRAFLKIQDGCDAHCTYCIIPSLRATLHSKPVADVVDEARRLVDAGHKEIVLTGIFLGAYGQPTALRRRQDRPTAEALAELVEALCTQLPDLPRLRLSSLEPGDMNDRLIGVLLDHPQPVPHFHLPLQSGSNRLLKRMNRQYGRDDFLRLVDTVQTRFDRPALSTDIITGFPGETDADFADTVAVAEHAGFMHIHAFPYSPRPGTAAARWTDKHIPGDIAKARVRRLNDLAAEQSLAFRRQFVGETHDVLIERGTPTHGRTGRYFDVTIDADVPPGEIVAVKLHDDGRGTLSGDQRELWREATVGRR